MVFYLVKLVVEIEQDLSFMHTSLYGKLNLTKVDLNNINFFTFAEWCTQLKKKAVSLALYNISLGYNLCSHFAFLCHI